MKVRYDKSSFQVQVDNCAWNNIKSERIADGDRLKIRANINDSISTFNANIDNTEVTLFLDVSNKIPKLRILLLTRRSELLAE